MTSMPTSFSLPSQVSKRTANLMNESPLNTDHSWVHLARGTLRRARWQAHYQNKREAIGCFAKVARRRRLVLVGPGARPCETDLDPATLQLPCLRELVLVDKHQEVLDAARAEAASCLARPVRVLTLQEDIAGGVPERVSDALAAGNRSGFPTALQSLAVDSSRSSLRHVFDICNGETLCVFSMCHAAVAYEQLGEWLWAEQTRADERAILLSWYVRFNSLVLQATLGRAEEALRCGCSLLIISDICWIFPGRTVSQFNPSFLDVVLSASSMTYPQMIRSWIWDECDHHKHLVLAVGFGPNRSSLRQAWQAEGTAYGTLNALIRVGT